MSLSKDLSAQDWQEWFKNLRVFLTPLALLYLLQVVAVIQVPNHVITLMDFAPTQPTIGAGALYLLNALIDLLRKYYQGPIKTA